MAEADKEADILCNLCTERERRRQGRKPWANIPSTSEQYNQPHTKDTAAGDESRREIGEIKEEIRAIESQLQEEKLHREGNERRLEDVEKKLVGVVTVPERLLAVLNHVLQILGSAKAEAQRYLHLG